MALNFSQQRRIFDPRAAGELTVIGLGSVGSRVALRLACVGVKRLTVYDDDAVASHNPSMSEYRKKDVGRFKVDAFMDILSDKVGMSPEELAREGFVAKRERYVGQPLRGAVAMCVDDMNERLAIWAAVLRDDPLVPILVDTRIDKRMISVFALRPGHEEDRKYYKHFLYRQSQANVPRCGEHGIAHVSSGAADEACDRLTTYWSTGSMVRHVQAFYGPGRRFQVMGG